MKGFLVPLSAHFCLIWLSMTAVVPGLWSQTTPVLNEVNLVVGPNYGQFIELYGAPNASLNGHSLVVVKSSFQGGVWVAQTQAVVGLEGQTFDAEGFLLIEGSGWQSTVAGIVLAESPASAFELNTTPEFEGIADAVFYGSYFLTSPQWQPIVEAIDPGAEEGLVEGGVGFSAGTDGLSRVPEIGRASCRERV